MNPRLSLCVVLLSLGLPVLPTRGLAADALVEDFSRLKNGGEPATLLGEGAETNDWNGRGLETWKVEEMPLLQKNVLRSLQGLPNWHPLGRPHRLGLGGAKALEVAMRVVQTRAHSANWVWVADELQNGYGIAYSVYDRRIQIFKLRGGSLPFEQSRDVSDWKTEIATVDATEGKISQPIEADTLVAIHLRIEQAAQHGPVTLTAWFSSEATGEATSFETPSLQVVDDGSGSKFGSAEDHGPVFDLSDLTHLALTGSSSKDGDAIFAQVSVEVLRVGGPAANAKR